jgi:enamidase
VRLRVRSQRSLATALVLASGVALLASQRPQISAGIRQFVKVDAPVVAITHVRVIDGTGAPARENETLLIRDGNIAAIGRDVAIPDGAFIIDGTGKSVMPGLVMMHEHLYYPTGPNVYAQLGQSFSRLYLAGGVTTMRTGGNVNGVMDLTLARRAAAFEIASPAIDATAPYLNGPNQFLQMHGIRDAADARRQVAYWAEMGATSFKAYMQISREALGAAIEEAHKRGIKVTGHLCSVTYAEAAALGIDNLEHGFAASTDFVATKQPDVCPGQGGGQRTIAALEPTDPGFQKLVQTLIARKVALTSTLTVFETFTPGRPMPPGVDVLVPSLRDQFRETHDRVSRNEASAYAALFPKLMKLEYAFAKAGGTLVAGTDPTGSGGVIPGYSNQRQLELLVEAGFTPLEAITIGTLNGARYLGRDQRIGSLAAGKQADLVLVNGDPSRAIADVRKVETVFRQGLGFDPAAIVASVSGRVGLW